MKLTFSEKRDIISIICMQHDTLYEDIVNHRNNEEDDELRLEKSCRKFLLAAREEGFNVDCGFYDLDEKIFKLEELGY